MAKRKPKKLSREQSWAMARNRANGQIGFMVGTIKSIRSLDILSEKEKVQLQTVRRILTDMKDRWKDQNSTSRQQFLDTWD